MMKHLLMLGVRAYRLLLSPWVGSQCRFEPTCSAYALEALERHGAAAGSYLTLRRLGRCQPWCEGGCDPVPEQAPRLFSGLAGLRRRAPAPSSSDESPSSITHCS
ncbi:membrane protein insertion efficiency factor YidD [Brachymonas sp.]|uniref:membrane protein insertion efficiency factor YidD n=1 Tax=unclassified Brachymonas TaxID=2621329 RepID=UPI0035B0190F